MRLHCNIFPALLLTCVICAAVVRPATGQASSCSSVCQATVTTFNDCGVDLSKPSTADVIECVCGNGGTTALENCVNCGGFNLNLASVYALYVPTCAIFSSEGVDSALLFATDPEAWYRSRLSSLSISVPTSDLFASVTDFLPGFSGSAFPTDLLSDFTGLVSLTGSVTDLFTDSHTASVTGSVTDSAINSATGGSITDLISSLIASATVRVSSSSSSSPSLTGTAASTFETSSRSSRSSQVASSSSIKSSSSASLQAESASTFSSETSSSITTSITATTTTTAAAAATSSSAASPTRKWFAWLLAIGLTIFAL
ncbi:hypothetical protein V1514DRAFT_327110 [Lipomyces japonicus]|uniref:uncharacterized protein n=1 Tax=Lipomyces japonicus TaxID=56871 RepID=UPI0034CDDB40